MKICFFGVGGVGGYFGALVAAKFNTEHEIYFIARGKHKEVINQKGLTLKKAGGTQIINITPNICTDSTNELPICDIIIISVKAYDLEKAVHDLIKISNEKTIILPLLNGVDIYERIRKILNTGIVLPSCVYIGTHIESPGIIFQKGGDGKIFFGPDPKYPEFDLQSLLVLFKNSGINFSFEENVYMAIWSKYLFIAAYGLVTATFDKSLGEILNDAGLSQIVRSIMSEIETIARRKNVSLESDIVEKSYLKAKEFPYDTKTSFQRDVESKGKVNEGDLFGGTLIRFGKELGIPTPNINSIYQKFLLKMTDL